MADKNVYQEGSMVVVGAGIAGLTAAQALQTAGRRVAVIDKGRGVGGRMATRRIEDGVFDHGAQFISVRDSGFQAAMADWTRTGVVHPWSEGFPTADGVRADGVRAGDGHTRFRAHPGMTAIPKALAQDLDVRLATRIGAISLQDGRWMLTCESGEVVWADGLVMTPPVPQSLQLLDDGGVVLPAQLDARLRAIAYHPCIVLMALLDGPSQIPAPGAVRMHAGDIRWIADNQQKGISPKAVAVTIHASPRFSQRYWDAEHAVIAKRLLAEAAPWVDTPVRTMQVHRWRYSQPVETDRLENPVLPGPPPLVFAGDAFRGGRVEGAYLSGLAAAEQLLAGIKLKVQ